LSLASAKNANNPVALGALAEHLTKNGLEALPYQILDLLPAAVYVTDAEGRLTYFNRAAVAFSGRVPELGTDQWCITFKLYHPDGRPMAHNECPMAIALREGRPIRGAVAIAERPDGSRVWFTPYPTPILDEDGNVTGGINMLIDVTDAMRAQEQQQRTAREQSALFSFAEKIQRASTVGNLYDAAFDCVHQAAEVERASILLFDEQGVMRFVASRGLSAKYCQAVEGHSPWKVGMTNPSPVALDSVEEAPLEEWLRAVILEEGIRALCFIPLMAGEDLIGKLMVYCDEPHSFASDELDFYLTVGRQLALAIKKKTAEDELLISREKLATAQRQLEFTMQSARVGTWSWDIANETLEWSEVQRKMWGYDAQEPITVEMGGKAVLEEDRPALQEALRRCREGETTQFDIEYRIIPKGSSSPRWIRSTGTLLSDERGNATSFVGVSLDITDRKEAEIALRSLNEQLEKLVTERTADLLKTNEQLYGFTYSVAHDIRQQIRGMGANASMLLIDAADNLKPEDRETLCELVINSKKLATLVDDLLTHARLGKDAPKMVAVDVSALAREVDNDLKERNAYAPNTIVEIADGMNASSDGSMLRIVLQNLIDNAAKYSATRQPPRIRVGYEQGAFYVRDNGIGLDMAFAEKIFMPFERLHRDNDYPGNGIGLANVKRIIDRHGGRVWVESTEGSGATFFFTLPDARVVSS